MTGSYIVGVPDTQHDVAHAANVLGALALALTDRVDEAVADSPGLAPSDAAAVSTLRHIHAAPTVEQLRRVLGLTHSGTVRLVDRLVRNGLIARGSGADARTVTLSLTPAGHEQATAITRTRAEVVADALAVLAPAERAELDRQAGRVLVNLMRGPGATTWICRRCDTGACGRYDDRCPIGREVRRRTPPVEEE